MYLVIDIGSNTIRAVVFCVEKGEILPVLNKKYSAGLAGYIDKDGMLSGEGVDLCLDILNEIRITIDAFSFDGVFPFATASLRNVANSEEVLRAVREETGLEVTVLSGEEEAYFDYYGAVRGSGQRGGILTDIGGGSTEIVVYSHREPQLTESLHIGSLNLYNQFVQGLIPTPDEIKRIQEETRKHLSRLSVQSTLSSPEVLCGVGGTARAALKLYNTIYHIDKKNNVYERCFLKKVLAMKWEEKKLMRYILKTAPERIHTLLPGMAILYTVAQHFGTKKIVTSSHGVREGYLRYQLEKEGVLDA